MEFLLSSKPDSEAKANAIRELSLKRLINEDKQLKKKILSGTWPPNIKIKPVIENGTKNLFKWEIIVDGRPDTLWENATYTFLVDFNENYFAGPIVRAPDDMEHIHIYPDKIVCLGLINKDTWSVETDLYLIPIEIEDLIHREPNLYSPANSKLAELYKENREEYNNYIRTMVSKMKTAKKKAEGL